jgi:hypothetical protein
LAWPSLLGLARRSTTTLSSSGSTNAAPVPSRLVDRIGSRLTLNVWRKDDVGLLYSIFHTSWLHCTPDVLGFRGSMLSCCPLCVPMELWNRGPDFASYRTNSVYRIRPMWTWCSDLHDLGNSIDPSSILRRVSEILVGETEGGAAKQLLTQSLQADYHWFAGHTDRPPPQRPRHMSPCHKEGTALRTVVSFLCAHSLL